MGLNNTSLKSRYYLLILPVIFGLISWQSWIIWSWMLSPVGAEKKDFANTKNEIQLSIPSGTAAQQIGIELEKTGLIRSVTAWKIWTIWLNFKDKNGQFQAGNYQFSTNDSLPEIAEKIRQGKVMETSFTIPEGWKITKIASYFESLGYFSADEFIKATRNIPRDKYSWLPENLPHLEGFLYPDTYIIPTGSFTPEFMVNLMLKRFETEALPLYNQAKDNTKFSLFDWVKLASIVEKEAVIGEERGIIAGVFINRLSIKMPLQTDPTVEYGLNIKQTADRPLTIKEVRTKNPYNTYINRGLPPTPIASPGKASLTAVLNPEKTPYLYFVARYDGSHVFSKTLTDHNRATIQIRQQRRNN
jgi:UPF0755 protein